MPVGAPVAPTTAALSPIERPQLSLGGVGGNSSTDISVGPWGGVFLIGDHAIVIPAGSICDPRTSSYGPGTWDAPCSPLSSTITIHAVSTTSAAGTLIDFSPSLRFVPSSNPSRWVWLYMNTPNAKGKSDLSGFNILYVPTEGALPVDETIADPSLRTYVDTRVGISSRRIKHFSGYQNPSGRSCDPATDGDCHPVEGGGINGP